MSTVQKNTSKQSVTSKKNCRKQRNSSKKSSKQPEELLEKPKKSKKICGIYKITNKINGKMYIGQSIDIKTRWKHHLYTKSRDTQLTKAIQKYGKDNFIFEIICEIPESVLDLYEISYIKYYETYKNGYNMTEGGNSPTNRGCKWSNIQREKMKEIQKTPFYYDGILYDTKIDMANKLNVSVRTAHRMIENNGAVYV